MAVLVAVAGAAALGYDVLSDATQTRPDDTRPGSRSELVFSVATRTGADVEMAAHGLWGACQGTVDRRVVAPGMTALGDGRFRLVVQPALGRHARDRITGCLKDVTIEDVKGNVVRIRDLND
jgi:hypothetical protein